jgi:hypothetical protein
MSQDQTQEQSAAGLNEPGSVLSAKEDDFDILKAGYQPVEKRGGSDFIPARGCVMEYLRLGDGTIEQS